MIPCFFVCLLFGGILIMTHKMSSCMLFPLLVPIPLLCVFLFGLVVVVCFWFAWFLRFWLCFWFLAGTARWTAYRSTTRLLWLSTRDSLAWYLQFIFLLRLNLCNDLAEAMKALDGKTVAWSFCYLPPFL